MYRITLDGWLGLLIVCLLCCDYAGRVSAMMISLGDFCRAAVVSVFEFGCCRLLDGLLVKIREGHEAGINSLLVRLEGHFHIESLVHLPVFWNWRQSIMWEHENRNLGGFFLGIGFRWLHGRLELLLELLGCKNCHGWCCFFVIDVCGCFRFLERKELWDMCLCNCRWYFHSRFYSRFSNGSCFEATAIMVYGIRYHSKVLKAHDCLRSTANSSWEWDGGCDLSGILNRRDEGWFKLQRLVDGTYGAGLHPVLPCLGYC